MNRIPASLAVALATYELKSSIMKKEVYNQGFKK
jgi:hypothetical protein